MAGGLYALLPKTSPKENGILKIPEEFRSPRLTQISSEKDFGIPFQSQDGTKGLVSYIREIKGREGGIHTLRFEPLVSPVEMLADSETTILISRAKPPPEPSLEQTQGSLSDLKTGALVSVIYEISGEILRIRSINVNEV